MKYRIAETAGKIVVEEVKEPEASRTTIKKVVVPSTPTLVLEVPQAIPTYPYYNSMRSLTQSGEEVEDDDDDMRILPLNYCYNIIYVIGCGGTGGYVVRDLARYLATLPYASRIIMVLMDGDQVEERNLIRQNFINRDIGKNKAEVLATRYGAAYGIKVVAIPNHLTSENFNNVLGYEFLNKLVDTQCGVTSSNESIHGRRRPTVRTNVAIISCVDNNKTRVLISDGLGITSKMKGTEGIYTNHYASMSSAVIEDSPVSNCYIDSLTWIDSGNESSAGQVICYYDTMFSSSRLAGNLNVLPWLKHNIPGSDRSIANYIAYCSALHYEDNFKKRLDLKTFSIPTGLAKGFNPYDAQAAAQAKFILGTVMGDDSNVKEFFLRGYFTFPITWVYPDVLSQAEDKTNLEMSCAERATVDTQNQIVNVQAASHVLYYASKIFASNPKNAFLDSYGCSWSGAGAKDYKLTKSNVSKILNPENMSKIWGRTRNAG